MNTKMNRYTIPILSFVTYLAMVTANGLANALPINGRGTGEISDFYANLFAPAGVTFAIWGVIYALLFGYVTYRLISVRKSSPERLDFLNKMDLFFIVSSVANTIWIFAWHYDWIGLSLILMFVILACLIGINMMVRKMIFSHSETLLIRTPFAVYFGWITVATIANITTYLVFSGWGRFNLSEVFWTDVVLAVGTIIGFIAIQFYRSYSYGMVLIWAYGGIALKHMSPNLFDWQYPSVIYTVFIGLAVFVVAEIILAQAQHRRHIKHVDMEHGFSK